MEKVSIWPAEFVGPKSLRSRLISSSHHRETSSRGPSIFRSIRSSRPRASIAAAGFPPGRIWAGRRDDPRRSASRRYGRKTRSTAIRRCDAGRRRRAHRWPREGYGAKDFARDFNARDLPGWGVDQWYAYYLCALTTDHAFLGVDLSALPPDAQPIELCSATSFTNTSARRV